MIGNFIVAGDTGIIFLTAVHFDSDNIKRSVIVDTSSFRVQVNTGHMGEPPNPEPLLPQAALHPGTHEKRCRVLSPGGRPGPVIHGRRSIHPHRNPQRGEFVFDCPHRVIPVVHHARNERGIRPAFGEHPFQMFNAARAP